MIAVGETIPDFTCRLVRAGGDTETIQSTDLFGTGRVVCFTIVGAFTPSCSNTHLPGFMANAEALKESGAQKLACLSVNDPFVMRHWAETAGAGEDILMLADGSGEAVRALGLDQDLSGGGLGMRAQRAAMIFDDGVLRYLASEDAPGTVEKTSADAVLEALQTL